MDEVIQRRRENVEKWRMQHKKASTEETEKVNELKQADDEKPTSSWTLEGEDDVEEEEPQDMDGSASINGEE